MGGYIRFGELAVVLGKTLQLTVTLPGLQTGGESFLFANEKIHLVNERQTLTVAVKMVNLQ